VLLPTEADLCNALGITEEEYFQFLEGVAAKVKERPEAYDLVPNIVNGPLVVATTAATTAAGTAGTLTFLGQFVVGVALSVIAYLLTPKPDTSRGSNRRTADIAGTRRFAPQSSFSSVQDLANLGDLIPLVFANRENGFGGVRVNSQLLWSQIVSLGRYQQLKILGMFSLGELADEPNFEGYAIGDLLLANYNNKKIELDKLTNNIPFVKKGSLTNKRKFKITHDEWFSGTRNPTTQATFGTSHPIPNATYFRLPYELLRISPNLDNDTVPPARNTLAKRRKNVGLWPARAGFVKVIKNEDRYTDDMFIPQGKNVNDYIYPESAALTTANLTDIKAGTRIAPKGTLIHYQIIGGETAPANNEEGGRAYQKTWTRKVGDDPGYMNHGVEDVNAISQTMREKADTDISFGEQYILGTALVRCTEAGSDPWINGVNDKSYHFMVLEEGKVQAIDNTDNSLGTHVGNPVWKIGGDNKYFELFRRKDKFYYEQYQYDLFNPATTYTLQKAAVGTVSDNRECHITEIGIRSKVFKEINFANVNSKPDEQTLDDIYGGKSTLTLGNISKYITRYSFFKLQIRQGAGSDWDYIIPDSSVSNHSGLFCVKGSSPEFQYNYIRIEHPKKQHEYRFIPWPGADVIKTIEASNNIKVSLLNANNTTDTTILQSFKSQINSDIVIKFAGNRELLLTKEDVSNPEWNLGNSDITDKNDPAYTGSSSRISTEGTLKSLTPNFYSSNDDADELQWTEQSETQWTRFYYGNGSTSIYREGITGSYTQPTYAGDNHTLILRGGSGLLFNLYINRGHVVDNVEQRNGPAWGNVVVSEYHEENISNVFGGGKTVTGVQFDYTNQATGKAGKYYPLIDHTIPGSGQDANDPGYGHPIVTGYPKGRPDLYYVRREEVVDVEAAQYTDEGGTQWKDQVVTLIDEDENNTQAKVLLNVWHEGFKSYATWSYIANSGISGFQNGQKLIIPEIPRDPSENDPGSDEYALPNVALTVTVDQFRRDIVEDIELNPYDAAADYWIFEGDRSSHLEGPEHEIVYCNEIIKDTTSCYQDIAYAALRIDSSKEWTSFSQFSAYFHKGIRVEKLIDSQNNHQNIKPMSNICAANPNAVSFGVDCEGKGATNLFPEIAYALLTDKTLGAGAVISATSVDRDNMINAAKFCNTNGYFWDGVISNKINLREFIFEQATYCLLDFTIIGGKFSLQPALPYKGNGDYKIDPDQAVKIKALFTDGNINDLNVSFLPSEDRQVFQANILYRHETENGFPETKSIVVRLAGSEHENDPVETFDLSGFCTNEQHAKDFGKYVLSVKDKTTHLITFKTASPYIQGLKPADYIRVYSTTQHTDRFKNGAILEGGKVVSQSTITGQNNIYYWDSSKEEVDFASNVNFDSPSALAAYAGSLFTIQTTDKTNQCYKIESMTFGEDGLIEISASHAPLDETTGALAILEGWDTQSERFIINSGD